MKQLLILLLVTSTALQGMTQIYVPSGKTRFGGSTTIINNWWLYVGGKSGQMSYGQKTQYSDTIEIVEPLQIHFIKIGNEVYQLVPHNTTIERVQPVFKSGTGTYYFGDPNIFTLPGTLNGLQVPANLPPS